MIFDAVIIGAGPSGLTLAIQLSKFGKKVALIDKEEKDKIGFMIGAGVIKLDIFNSLGIKRSTGEELLAFIDTFNVYSCTGKTHKTTSYSGISVNRSLFTQRLINIAEEQGVVIRHSTTISSLNIENEYVTGVTSSTGEVISGKIVIDASGFNRKFVSQIPDSFKIEKDIKPKDIATGYVYVFDKPEKTTYLTSYLAVNEGYIWKTPTEIGYGSINKEINIKKTLDDFIAEHFKIDDPMSKHYEGSLPVRQNLYNMVGNGFTVCGDNACMTNPIEGTGIFTGMLGAKISADVINKCLDKNDLSQKALWEVNVNYNKTQGANLAYMDML
ncbi:MAG: NAD(P)/FAD-dependent oxidoreductase, partial [Cyanobacteriota bacterium]